MRGPRRPRAIWLLPLGLAACTTDGLAPTAGPSTMFGLVSGPLPEPKPFVVQARPAAEAPYPAVGAIPADRPDKVLTPAERAKLEADLKAAGGQQP
jgi:hypothetical protein